MSKESVLAQEHVCMFFYYESRTINYNFLFVSAIRIKSKVCLGKDHPTFQCSSVSVCSFAVFRSRCHRLWICWVRCHPKQNVAPYSKSFPSHCKTRKNRRRKCWISIDQLDGGLNFQAIYSLRGFFYFKERHRMSRVGVKANCGDWIFLKSLSLAWEMCYLQTWKRDNGGCCHSLVRNRS